MFGSTLDIWLITTTATLPPHTHTVQTNRKHWAHQLLECGLVQVALESKLAERFPRWLIGLHFHSTALHCALMANWAAGHQGRPGQSLEAL